MHNEQPNAGKLGSSEVEIEAHGIAGTLGRWAAPLVDTPPIHLGSGAFWIKGPARETDVHAGFITNFSMTGGGEVRFRVIAPAAYRLTIDNSEVAWGPLRFAPAMPEYQECRVTLPAGPHRAALHVHHEGLTTRLAARMPPFVWVDVTGDLCQKPVWFGRHLHEYLATGLRTSPLQGWMEWTENPGAGTWHMEDPTHDPGWHEAVAVTGLDKILGTACASPVRLPVWPSTGLRAKRKGVYRDNYTGYRFDDPAVAFMLADPTPDKADDHDGPWWRYDLGRIRIGAIEFDVQADCDGEAIVGYAERLGADGRPVPVAPLSAGPTRFIQRFAFRAGHTPIRPLQALGCRHLEIRLAGAGNMKLQNVRFRERDYLGDPHGRMTLHDETLDRIWNTGIDTMRASVEDSVVDPVRERGEWIGDISVAAIELLAIGWNNLAPARRALYHAAASARDDGMVAGCGPGELIYLGTYAAQWVNACVRCAELEGSTALLADLEGPARRNVEAILSCVADDGRHSLPWAFVDWGYKKPGQDQIEPSVLAHVVAAVDGWNRWQQYLGRTKTDTCTAWNKKADTLRAIVKASVADNAQTYHNAVLGERIGAIGRDFAVTETLRKLQSTFPFDRKARRLRDPTKASTAIVTPYFTNYSVDLLLKAGKVEEVIDIWRKTWGWMLDRGATTWWEVFDERWSHCHYWSGSPTWQMSRRILGADSTLHHGRPAVRIAVHAGNLPRAKGRLAFPTVGWAEIAWHRRGEILIYTVNSPAPWTLLRQAETVNCRSGITEFQLSCENGVAVA